MEIIQCTKHNGYKLCTFCCRYIQYTYIVHPITAFCCMHQKPKLVQSANAMMCTISWKEKWIIVYKVTRFTLLITVNHPVWWTRFRFFNALFSINPIECSEMDFKAIVHWTGLKKLILYICLSQGHQKCGGPLSLFLQLTRSTVTINTFCNSYMFCC